MLDAERLREIRESRERLRDLKPGDSHYEMACLAWDDVAWLLAAYERQGEELQRARGEVLEELLNRAEALSSCEAIRMVDALYDTFQEMLERARADLAAADGAPE
jgi:hypothetical protein